MSTGTYVYDYRNPLNPKPLHYQPSAEESARWANERSDLLANVKREQDYEPSCYDCFFHWKVSSFFLVCIAAANITLTAMRSSNRSMSTTGAIVGGISTVVTIGYTTVGCLPVLSSTGCCGPINKLDEEASAKRMSKAEENCHIARVYMACFAILVMIISFVCFIINMRYKPPHNG